MSSALCATDLGKRYGRKWALSGCTMDIPVGRVVGLVGPNGAGKSTLLHLAVGLLTPSTGSVTVIDEKPASSAEQLGRIGFVAQDTPVYTGLSIAAPTKTRTQAMITRRLGKRRSRTATISGTISV